MVKGAKQQQQERKKKLEGGNGGQGRSNATRVFLFNWETGGSDRPRLSASRTFLNFVPVIRKVGGGGVGITACPANHRAVKWGFGRGNWGAREN